VVVDDAHQGVTHVVRGQDLFDATSLQNLLGCRSRSTIT
jgi:glutamyl/glutaminyl-tRNA synthetase